MAAAVVDDEPATQRRADDRAEQEQVGECAGDDDEPAGAFSLWEHPQLTNAAASNTTKHNFL